MPFIAGVATPSQMLVVLGQGFTLQNFFPVEVAGGIKRFRAMAGPVPEVRFMPTGGITPDLTALPVWSRTGVSIYIGEISTEGCC